MGKGVIVPTYACNQRCECCYAMSNIISANKYMDIPEMKATIDFFRMIKIKTITILGGEPLAYKHIFELVEYALKQGITSWIVTNGTKLADPEMGNELMNRGLIGGCISLFGMNSEYHDRLTGRKGAFENVLKALENNLKYKWNFNPMITVGKEAAASLLDDISVLKEMGYKKVYINYGIPNVNAEFDSKFDLTPLELAEITKQLYEYQNQNDMVFIFNCEKNKIPLCLFDEQVFSDLVERKQIGFGCELVQGNTVVVEPGGDVLGCSHWVGHNLMNIYKDYEKLSLIDEEEFWDIWMNGYPAKFRNKAEIYPYEKCNYCDKRKEGLCKGGCKSWMSQKIVATI